MCVYRNRKKYIQGSRENIQFGGRNIKKVENTMLHQLNTTFIQKSYRNHIAFVL